MAETRDHVPSRMMFYMKRRPAGLEFAACRICQKFSSKHEQVASLLSRIFPDPKSKEAKRELRKLFNACARNNEGLIEELLPSPRQLREFQSNQKRLPDGTHPLNANGPILNESMAIFGAKLGIALHYEHTGNIVPETGGVAVRWYSNYETYNDDIPPEILKILGPLTTLSQGQWSVKDQFQYRYVVSDTEELCAVFAVFREAFALLTISANDLSFFPTSPGMLVYSPRSIGQISRVR